MTLCAVLFRRPLRHLSHIALHSLPILCNSLQQARSVAYTSVIVTQLAQTLDAGRAEGGLTRPVLAAVGGSLGVLAVTLTVPPLRNFLSLAMSTPFGWVLIGGGAVLAVVMSRVLARLDGLTSLQLNSPPTPPLLTAPAESVTSV